MPVNTYGFLNNDSYLDCSRVQADVGYEEVAIHLASKPEDHKGILAEKEIVEILEVVNNARTISDYDKNLILPSLGEIDIKS